MTSHQKTPTLFLSLPHPCSYLPGKMATSLPLDPRQKLDSESYAGFTRRFPAQRRLHLPAALRRMPCVRTGAHPGGAFQAQPWPKRIWRRNQDLEVRAHPAVFSSEHFSLYALPGEPASGRRHGRSRSGELSPLSSPPAASTRCSTKSGLTAGCWPWPWSITCPTACRRCALLRSDEKARGLGIYAVLWQVEEARRRGLPRLPRLLDRESPKMAYKANYAPLEAYLDNRWSAFNPAAPDTQR